MKQFFTAILMAFSLATASAQCPIGNDTLTTQAEVNDFGWDWPNCTDLQGNLYIEGAGIFNLNSLSGLQTIQGELSIINCDALTSLSGLENLSAIDTIYIFNNAGLTSLSGLGNLNSVGGYLSIYNNTSLTSLNGLESLNSVDGYMGIEANTALTSLNALESLSSVGEYFWIVGNTALPNLSGLESLNSVGSIDIFENAALTSLSGLENLSGVSGDMGIGGNAALTSLSGLENLSAVGGDMQIEYNAALTSFNGLENLSSVGGKFHIVGNILPTSLNGLESLNSVGNYLIIDDSGALTSLSGLENLTSVGGMMIYQSNSLTSLNGLDNLSSVGSDLIIESNDALTSLNGLGSLSSVGDYFFIETNGALTSLNGLENLSYIGADLYIKNNVALTSLSSLENLSSIGIGLHIYGNLLLSVCNEFAICSYLTDFDPIYTQINDNAPGCNSIEEVQLSCMGVFSRVLGVAYADLTCDGTFNSTDGYLQNHLVIKADGTPVASTNSSGAYMRLLPPNTTTNFGLASMLGYTVQPDTYQIVTDTQVVAYTGYDFRLCPDSLFTDLGTSIAAVDPPQPGFNNMYHVCYENNGTQPENATLTLTFSGDGAALLTVVAAAGGTVWGNTVTWDLTDVPVFAQVCYTVEVSFSSTTPLGTQLVAEVIMATESNDNNLHNNSFVSNQTVVEINDPNDKTVSPTKVDLGTATDPQRLTYTVRFQNTGTFSATFVEVLDTLEANLDIRTLELISASHAYSLTVLEDHILKFRFNNINLPDSTSDEPGSHGYVMFSLETVDGLTLGDVVRNSAAIYFDYNTPVITNIAATEFVVPTTTPMTQSLHIQPNPATATVTIQWQQPVSGVLTVTDLAGREVARLPLENSSTCTLDCHAWPTGVYLVRIGSAAARLVVMD